MSEEETKTTNDKGTPTESITGGNKPEATDFITRSDNIVKRMEEANKEAKEILARQEAIVARNILGGKAEGPSQVEEKKEESPVEYAKRILGGG